MNTRSGRNRLVVAVVALIVVAGVVFALMGSARAFPPSLIVVPSAKDVHYANLGGSKQVRYEVNDPYPAKAALKEISSQLAKQGWKPMKEDWMNPKMPSSHVRGWGEHLDGNRKPEEQVKQWLADWTNPQGDVVRYMLRYRSPVDGPPNNSKAEVSGIYTRARLAKLIQESIRREQHQKH